MGKTATGLILVVAALLGGVLLLMLGGKAAAPGNRSPEALVQMPDMPRVAILGTSLSAYGSWPDAVEGALTACVKRPVAMEVHAKGGATSAFGLAQADAVAASRPDIVLIEFAINDADLRRLTSIRRSLETHRAIISRLRSDLPQARLLLMTTNGTYGVKSLLRPFLPRYDAQYRFLADDEGVGLIDLSPAWDSYVRDAGWHMALPDGVHPTGAAQSAVTVPAVTSMLAQVLGMPCAN